MINFLILKFETGKKSPFWHSDKIAFLSGFKTENISKLIIFYIDTAGRFVKLGIIFIFYFEIKGEFKESHGMLSVNFWACLKDICWGFRRPEQSFTHSVPHWTLHMHLSAFMLLFLTHEGFVNISMYSTKQCLPGSLKKQKIAGWCHLRDLAICVEMSTFSTFF